MSDPIDIASESEALALAAALTLRKPSGPQPTGRCHYCDSQVADSLRWCDISCRDDWEADTASARRSGRRRKAAMKREPLGVGHRVPEDHQHFRSIGNRRNPA